MRPLIHCSLINDPFGDPGLYAEFMFEKGAILFDIGDIHAIPTRKLLRVEQVFVSHAHMDHFSGFDHLLRLFLGRDKTLRLFGPAPFIDQVEHKLRAYTWNVIGNYQSNLVIEVTEVLDGRERRAARFQSKQGFAREFLSPASLPDDVLFAQLGFRIRCAVLDHGTPCLGFALEEDRHVNIQKDKLAALGLAVGPWLRAFKAALLADAPDTAPIAVLESRGLLQETATRTLGEIRGIATMVAGQRIAYLVDIRYHEENVARIERLAADVDLLYIESVFLDEDRDQAARKNHLTAWQAGTIGRRIRAKRIEPFHFSPRYAGQPADLPAEAQRAFRGHSEIHAP